MKLPFEFGPKLFFRLGLPGLVLALTTAPLVFAFANVIKVDIDRWEVIAVSTVIWGWGFVLADMPIYMLYEGRRFWPQAALDWGMNREERRLAGLHRQVAENTRKKDPRASESDIELLNFPINIHTGEAEVRFPTRLGNLVTAYEEHTYIYPVHVRTRKSLGEMMRKLSVT
jgi:hypothetical protein